jgi:hypothetical protein
MRQESLPVGFCISLFGYLATEFLGGLWRVFLLLGLKLGQDVFVLESRTGAVVPHLSGLRIKTAMVAQIEATAMTLSTGLLASLHCFSFYSDH